MSKTKNPPIILASASPRRKELLEALGIPFTIHPSDADETIDPEWSPPHVVEILALRKAYHVAEQLRDPALVIGSDTIVVIDERILGKPRDRQDAFEMLHMLQGKTHSVYSGVAVVQAGVPSGVEAGDQPNYSDQMNGGDQLNYKVGHVETKVKMGSASRGFIETYINTVEPIDKAGAYAIQGLGSLLVEGIEGDYFNVVGLPLRFLSQLLSEFGISIFDFHT